MNGNAPFVVELKRSLITWDLYLRAQSGRKGATYGMVYPSFLIGKLRCECGELMARSKPGARHHEVYCPNNHGVRFFIEEIERGVLGETKKRLEGLSSQFFQAAQEEVIQLELAFQAKEAERRAEVSAIDVKIKDGYRNLMAMDQRAMALGNELMQEMLDQKGRLEERLRDTARMPTMVLADEDAAIQLSKELDSLARSLPLRPDTPEDEWVMEKLAVYISSVTIQTGKNGMFDLEIAFKDVAGDSAPSITVIGKGYNVSIRGHNTAVSNALFGEQMATFTARLTDAEWKKLPKIFGVREKTPFIRDCIDAILLWSDNDVPAYRYLREVGYPELKAKRSIAMLPLMRGDLIAYLRRTRGAEFNIRMPMPAVTGGEAKRLCSVFHPVFLLPQSVSNAGSECLDDAQWLAIAHLLPKAKKFSIPLDDRVALDGYFALLRTDYALSQALLVGLKPPHAARIVAFHKSGLFNRIVEVLLALEGYEIPPDYVMPKRPDGTLDKSVIPKLEYLREVLRRRVPLKGYAEPVLLTSAKLRVGHILVDMNHDTVSTIDGEIIRLPQRLVWMLKHFFENPEKAFSLSEIGTILRPGRPLTDTARGEVYLLRRLLRPYCREAELGIVFLGVDRGFMSTSRPTIIEGIEAERAVTYYVAPPAPTTLVQSIVAALTGLSKNKDRLVDLDFLLGNGEARRVRDTQLRRRIREVNELLVRVYPLSNNPLYNLSRVRRTHDGVTHLQFLPTQLGKRVRLALGLPQIGS
ncbi:hypothetical protein ABIB57_001952 [Devosia sp. UYZn731]|uniref:hypothetical protein n=1 Tax=Devosia sp. UYZn731 TaxID=3156345 RepID=UPI0033982E71